MQNLIRLTFALCLLVANGTASPQDQAAIDIEAAIRTESIEGDLEAAIAQYRALAESSNRSVAARSLLRLGGAYEKLGSTEARQAYVRLVQNFPEQTGLASAARLRLAELGPDPEDMAAGPRLVALLSEDLVSAADRYSLELSPDGSRVAFIGNWEADPSRRGPLARNSTRNVDIFVADRSGTVVRPLLSDWGALDEYLDPPGEGDFITNVENLRWSPDSKHIAFTAMRPSDERIAAVGTLSPIVAEPGDNVNAVFLVNAEGGSPRQIGPAMKPDLDVAPEVFYDIWWGNDSQSLGFVSGKGVFSLSLDGEISQIAEMQAGRNTEFGGFSPDGRWLAFTVGSERLGNFLYVLPATGGRGIRQARTFSEGAGLRIGHRPAWSHDGRAIYAPSDADGTSNTWRYAIDPETGQPQGDPAQVTSYLDATVTALKTLRAGNGLAYTLEQTRTTINVADADRPDEFEVVTRGSNPRLSSDGRTIYYIGEGSEEAGIYAIDRDGRRQLADERPEIGPFGDGFELSPDGSALLYRAMDEDGRHLFTVDTLTGEQKKLYTFAADTEPGVGFYSPDGEWIAFTESDGLFRMPASGGAAVRIASLWQWYSSFIRWSPDGRWIAALGWESPEVAENSVYLVSATGGEPRRLRPLSGDQRAYLEGLEWHPDSQRLSYFDYEVVRTRFVDLDGNVSEPIFDHREGWEYLGRWRADGRHYDFGSSLEGMWQGFVFDAESGAIVPSVRVDDASANNSIPEFSRDQTRLVWTSKKLISQLWLLENVD